MRRPLCLLCLFYVIGVSVILQLFFVPAKGNEKQLKDDERCTVLGEVYRIQWKNEKAILYLKVSTIQFESDNKPLQENKYGSGKFCGGAVCYMEDGAAVSNVKIGNRIFIKGTCRLYEPAANDGQFDMKMYYRIQGIDFFMTGCRLSIADKGFRPYEQGLMELRRYLSRTLSDSLPSKYAGIMQSMFLGEREGLDEEIKLLFQRNGISHILAISGLHISFLGMGVFGMLKKLKLPRFLGAFISMGLVVSFGVMTGQSASAVRSIVMFSLFMAASLRGRTYDLLTAAALAGIALLIKQPLYVYHSGFLLSFGAVMGLGLIMPCMDRLFPKERMSRKMILNPGRKVKAVRFLKTKICASLKASISVSLAIFPIQLYFFFTFPLYSLLVNLLIIPFMGALMAVGAAGLFAACLCPPWGCVFMMPCRWMLFMYEYLCRAFDRLPGKNPVLGRPALWQAAIYYGILLCLVFFGKGLNKRKLAGILCAAILLLCLRIRWVTTCTMLDVGQGDCLVIEEKSGCNILVDGGSSDVSKAGQYRIIPYLKSHGIDEIDYAFISHGDFDHTAGILEMLSGDGQPEIKIRCLVFTRFALTDPQYDGLLEEAGKQGIKVLFVSEGDRFYLGNTDWECLYPGVDAKGSGNDQSMVLLMKCNGIKTLFTGDLPGEKEGEIPWENVHILKTAHHGSKNSTTEEFLGRCLPKTAIVSAGKDNSYGHPHKETLKRLEKTGAAVYGTPFDGAITIRYEKRKYSVLTY